MVRSEYSTLLSPKNTENNHKLTIRPVDVLPRILPANHVLHVLPLHLLALVVFLADEELVGAGAAFEAGLAFGVGDGGWGARDGEGVGAGGTDWW